MNTPRELLQTSFLPSNGAPAVDWIISDDPVDYQTAINWMEDRAQAIAQGEARECVWLLEHTPLYTAGTSADSSDLVQPDRFPVHQTGRGGQYTYHGPGQRVAYVMLDLKRRQPDVRVFVSALERWVIDTLDAFNVVGERREDRVGVWVARPEKAAPDGQIAEDKIAAIGIRLRKWVSFHGIAINVEPDLEHFAGIIPCGVTQHGVTSLIDLGLPVTLADVDIALKAAFQPIFGLVDERS
ncbi:MAG: lipoyl(octanoyl) transferase LipB [Rhizobiaceae bacterium]|nr:lipoyl(octanoyl) transferase LipB [Rhizobiaceae bacterium]